MKINVNLTEKEFDFLLQCIIARRVQRKDLIEKLDDDTDLVEYQKEVIRECDKIFDTIYQKSIIKQKG